MFTLLTMDLQSLLTHCLHLLANNNKPLLRDYLCDVLDMLDNEIENDDSDNDTDRNDDDDTDSVASDDIPFSDIELSFIKNKAHYDYLIKYSLIPTFLHQYYKPFMDDAE